MMMALLPQIILGPFIGPYIDRWNRKSILICADLSIAIITLGLVILFFTDNIEVWHIYVAIITRAIGQSFHSPAMYATIPLIVPPKHLVRVSGLNHMLSGVINIAAPPAGALLLAILPMQGVLAIDIVTALIAVSCLAFVTIPKTIRAAGAAATSAIKEMIQGFRYIWSWKGLAFLLGGSALLNFLFIPAFSLLPIMVTTHLDGDVIKLGWLESSFGIGIIAGGLILGAWGGFKKGMLTVLLGLTCSGISVIVLGFTSLSLFMLGISACFVIGIGLTFTNGPVMAIIQKVVPNDMQGRVFSLMGSIGAAASPLGLVIAGPVADAMGIRSLYFAAGIGTLLLCFTTLFIPTIMKMGAEPLEKQGIPETVITEENT
jgi:MFS transporter, DHA3 family, macrolide efflux protein